MDQKIEITLFNHFEIKMDGEPILTSLSNTRKTKLFLSYLLLYKQKAISHRELFELLWSGEDYSNPGTALRTLLYRYRALVDKMEIEPLRNSIISRRGAYQWNQELDVSIDIFDFDDYSKIGLNQSMSVPKRKQCLQRAIDLYTGPLLPDSGEEHWVVPKAVYYRDLYVQDVLAYISLLKEEGAYEEIGALCRKALALARPADMISLEEEVALARGKMGEELKLRYESTLSSLVKIELVIGDVQKSMETEDSENSAFVCEYDVFKDIYHLQRRLLARTGDTMFLSLLSMERKSDDDFEPLQHEKVMTSLLDIVRHELRCGDSICRFSDNTYAIMFPADSFENAIKIMERVKSSIAMNCKEKDVLIVYRIRPLKNAKE
ncbi:MAG: hypothetical protein K5649_10475 [Lachnospiraceae bacterium]|nr:hypothetical protein [Lachnospiraceae bacterium]